jgi:two-component system sensor histidine kinase SenX3
VVKRLDAALERYEHAGPAGEQYNGGVVDRLERALSGCADRVDRAEIAFERLMAALQQLDQGVVVCDDHGDVIYRNARAAAFVGARHGEALAERAVEELLAAAAAGEESEQTIDLFGPPRRTLTIKAFPISADLRPLGAVAVVEDISERRRLESMRRDFVANISHELKTPVGALGLVAETIEGEDDPEVIRRLSRRMKAEAERLARIIEDLLDLSKIEADEMPRRDALHVTSIVDEAVELVRPVAERRNIRIEVCGPDHRLGVTGDQRQLVSAVNNLVENAVKYSEAGSAVRVDTSGSDAAWVEIAVVDHGLGIPSRDLERIFERFYRVDRARSRDTGGTGLGLSIVRHVASNHGGEVQVASREGEGSTFTLRLPAAKVMEREDHG